MPPPWKQRLPAPPKRIVTASGIQQTASKNKEAAKIRGGGGAKEKFKYGLQRVVPAPASWPFPIPSFLGRCFASLSRKKWKKFHCMKRTCQAQLKREKHQLPWRGTEQSEVGREFQISEPHFQIAHSAHSIYKLSSFLSVHCFYMLAIWEPRFLYHGDFIQRTRF